jgi:hypothetical protein
MGTGGPFPGGKSAAGRDADHSPPSSAEVENEYELNLLSPQAPPWRVAGLLYLFLYMTLGYKVLVGKPEGKRQLRRPRPRWEDGIRMDLGLRGVDWIRLAQSRDR